MTADPQLPREPAAEQYCLGCLVNYPERAGEVFSRLSAADFFDVDHQHLFARLSEQYRAGAVDLGLLRCQIPVPPSSSGDYTKDYLDDLGDTAVTTAHLPVEAKKLIEARRKRQRIETFETLIEHSYNGYASGDIDTEVGAAIHEWQREREADNPRFRIYSAAELDSTTFETSYLIDNLLVDGEPCAIGAPEKSLKTSLMLDLGISLNVGGYFLGTYRVNKRCRFLMFSGESGMATLQETARRICLRAGYSLADLDGFSISPDLPQLDNPGDMAEFEAKIADEAPDVVALDPMFLCLGDVDEKAANLFSMGALLRRARDVCQRTKSTLLFAHHTSGVQSYGATPKLSWLAFSGFKQFVRQWLLLNRMEEYVPGSGFHRLKMVAGGSSGHNGLWIVEVNEGTRNDIGGRRWEVAVKSIDEARQSDQQRKSDTKANERQEQLDADRAAVCRLMAKYPEGKSKTFIRDHSDVSGRRWSGVFAAMFEAGELVECEITVGNKKTLQAGYRLPNSQAS